MSTFYVTMESGRAFYVWTGDEQEDEKSIQDSVEKVLLDKVATVALMTSQTRSEGDPVG